MAVTPAQHAAHTSGIKAMVNSFLHPKPRIRISNTKVRVIDPSKISKVPLKQAIKDRSPFHPGPTSSGIGVGP